MKKLLIFIFLSFITFSKDLSIVVKEDAINKFLRAAGSFSDETEVDLKVTKYKFIWSIYDAKISIQNNKSLFNAKIDIISDGKVRKGTAEGVAHFRFNGATQKLNINIKDVKVRGLDVFNLVGFYEPKYDLPIKIMREEKIEINKGKDGKIFLIPDLINESVKVQRGELLIEANIRFIEEK